MYFLAEKGRFSRIFVSEAARMDRIHCNLWDKKGASPSWVDAPQSADKAHKRKNRSDKIEIRGDFCFRRWIC